MTDMKKSRFTEEQIIGFIKRADAGAAGLGQADFLVSVQVLEPGGLSLRGYAGVALRGGPGQLLRIELPGFALVGLVTFFAVEPSDCQSLHSHCNGETN